MVQITDIDTDYGRGFRHGTDGIVYFPGPECLDHAAYHHGYVDGRNYWKEQFGSYPAGGDSRWDHK